MKTQLLLLLCLNLPVCPAVAGLLFQGHSTTQRLFKSCESLLFSASDRIVFSAVAHLNPLMGDGNSETFRRGFEAWIATNRFYLYGPTTAGESDDVYEKRNEKVRESLVRWAPLIRENLNRRGLYLGEKNRGQTDHSFEIDRAGFEKENPQLLKLPIPADYKFAIQPLSWVAQIDAFVDVGRKTIYLPPSSLWRLSDEAEISILHEGLHAVLAENRDRQKNPSFPFVIEFTGETQKRVAEQLASYSPSFYFTTEEVAVRVGTTAYRLQQVCDGRRSVDMEIAAYDDLSKILMHAFVHLDEVGPPLTRALNRTDNPAVELLENSTYAVDLRIPEIKVLLEKGSWSEKLTARPKEMKTSLRESLRRENELLQRAYRLFRPLVENLSALKKQGSNLSWTPLCAHREEIWQLTGDMGINPALLK